MRDYKNMVLELLEDFYEYTISLIPREQKNIANSLDNSASLFKIPIYPNKRYEIQVKHRPYIPDNVKNWKVFEDNNKVKRFLQNEEEFFNTQIDDENQFEENPLVIADAVLDERNGKYLNVFVGKEVT